MLGALLSHIVALVVVGAGTGTLMTVARAFLVLVIPSLRSRFLVLLLCLWLFFSLCWPIWARQWCSLLSGFLVLLLCLWCSFSLCLPFPLCLWCCSFSLSEFLVPLLCLLCSFFCLLCPWLLCKVCEWILSSLHLGCHRHPYVWEDEKDSQGHHGSCMNCSCFRVCMTVLSFCL